jgi:hypothetical protein
LGDWLQAESEVIENSPVAPLYWRSRSQYFTESEGEDRSNS